MLRYYPPSKVITDQKTSGDRYSLNGVPYVGNYYITFDGKAYSGPNPQVGPNELLSKIPNYLGSPILNVLDVSAQQKQQIAINTKLTSSSPLGRPESYQPQPLESDYRKGYVTRYFTKKENENGYITEISQSEYNAITNGTVTDYDISMYQVTKILWKLTGPLNSQRKSQYNVIPGIIDTNKRLTEAANKNFYGIIDFIGGDYTKFARPTA